MNIKLNLLIDTGTWLKLDKLYRAEVIREDFLIGLYSLADIYITPEIEVELLHFSPYSWKKELTYVIPVKNEKHFRRTIKDGFDEADASLFGIINIADFYILTEDRPLMEYGHMHGLNFLFLIEFFTRLLESDIITKRELYSLNQAIYDLKNIDKKLYSKTKKFAQHY